MSSKTKTKLSRITAQYGNHPPDSKDAVDLDKPFNFDYSRRIRRMPELSLDCEIAMMIEEQQQKDAGFSMPRP